MKTIKKDIQFTKSTKFIPENNFRERIEFAPFPKKLKFGMEKIKFNK